MDYITEMYNQYWWVLAGLLLIAIVALLMAPMFKKQVYKVVICNKLGWTGSGDIVLKEDGVTVLVTNHILQSIVEKGLKNLNGWESKAPPAEYELNFNTYYTVPSEEVFLEGIEALNILHKVTQDNYDPKHTYTT